MTAINVDREMMRNALADTDPEHDPEWDYGPQADDMIAALSKAHTMGGETDDQIIRDGIEYAKAVLTRVFEARGRLRDGVLASSVNIAAHRLAEASAALAAAPTPPVQE